MPPSGGLSVAATGTAAPGGCAARRVERPLGARRVQSAAVPGHSARPAGAASASGVAWAPGGAGSPRHGVRPKMRVLLPHDQQSRQAHAVCPGCAAAWARSAPPSHGRFCSPLSLRASSDTCDSKRSAALPHPTAAPPNQQHGAMLSDPARIAHAPPDSTPPQAHADEGISLAPHHDASPGDVAVLVRIHAPRLRPLRRASTDSDPADAAARHNAGVCCACCAAACRQQTQLEQHRQRGPRQGARLSRREPIHRY